MVSSDKRKAFGEKFIKTSRLIFSSFILGLVALTILFINSNQLNLNHPNWFRFFAIASAIVLWLFINKPPFCELAGTINSRLLDNVPDITPRGPMRFIWAVLYIAPGFLFFGHFTTTLIVAIFADPIGTLQETLPELISTMPIIGELFTPDSWAMLLVSDFVNFWPSVISLGLDNLLLSIITLVVSAVARLLTGTVSRRIEIRILAGFSSLIYVMLLANAIKALITGSFLDPSHVGQLFFTLDRLGGIFLILGYPVLLFSAAFFLSSFFVPMIMFCGYSLVFMFIFLLIPELMGISFLSEAINSTPGLISIGILIFGGYFYSIGKNIWDISPSGD